MKISLTVQDVIKDIEFELMQETIISGDLPEGVRQVKQYQSQVRQQLFGDSKNTSWKEVAGRQFQINDMLLSLLQEIAVGQRELTHKFERFGEKQRLPENLSAAELVEFYNRQNDTSVAFEKRDTADIQNVLSNTMQMKLAVQPSSVPLIGSWVNRIKIALHNLVLFYLKTFAKKQVAVNQTYGNWLLYLDGLNVQQQREIAILQTRLQALEQQFTSGNRYAERE